VSLLIVRCPLKPFHGGMTSSPGDWQDEAQIEQFEWCLIQGEDASTYQTGIGSTESMPYADQALVLMPTLDVRLIEAKVPLANAKKLQQILPNLVEEYLLSGAESISVQAFPPVPGKPAIQRTVAIIERAWNAWLSQQLGLLLCPRVRLIPDCLVLDWHPADESNEALAIAPVISLMRSEGNIILTKRTGEQLGVSWVEPENIEQGTSLPSMVGHEQAVEISWDWLAPSAAQYIKITTSSKSANFALNLLPKTFRQQASKLGRKGLTDLLARQRGEAGASATAGMAWTDPLVWRPALLWATYALAVMVLGLALHLTWLAVDNWRWGNKMDFMAAQSLSSASAASLAQNIASASPNASPNASLNASPNSNGDSPFAKPTTVLQAFIKQATQEQRRQGVPTDADFSAMTAKLLQLKNLLGPEVLQKIDYDGYALTFELKPGSTPQNSAEVVQKARSLGLVVTPLEANRFRLEPYAGLGLSL